MRTCWFVLITLVACGGSSEQEPSDPGPPILDRSPRLSHACSITHDVAVVIQSQPLASIALARTRAGYLAARGAYDTESYQPQIAVAELRFDPVELADPVVEMPGAGYYARPALAVRDDKVGLSWVDDSATIAGHQLRFAVLDDAGELVADPVTLHGADDEVMIVSQSQAATAGGFAMLWSDDAALRFVALDEGGQPTSDPVTVRRAQVLAAHLTSHGEGLAAIWIEESGVYLALLDGGGTPRSDPALLAGPGREGTFLASPFVVAVGDELAVAWTEGYHSADYNDPDGGYAVARIARASGDGELLGPIERLQAAEDGIVSAVSSLRAVDGALAVAWTRETYIPVCGGCMSDATVGFILLDPVDLVPSSEAVELVGASGLKSAPMTGTDDGDVAFFMTVDYHALADLAAAQIRCTARP